MAFLTAGSGGSEAVGANNGSGTGEGYNGTAVYDASGNVVGYQGSTATHAYLSNGQVQTSSGPVYVAPTLTGTYVYDGAGNYLGGTGSGAPAAVSAAGGPPTSGAGSSAAAGINSESTGTVVMSQFTISYWWVFAGIALAGVAVWLILRH